MISFVAALMFPIVLLVAERNVIAFQPSPKISVSQSIVGKYRTATSKTATAKLFDLEFLHDNAIAAKAITTVTCVLLFSAIFLPTPAWSQVDVTKGETLFQANCAGCHAGGNNYVSEKRTLQKDAIQQYRGSTDQATITNFVQNGMPHKLLPMKTPMVDKDYSDVVAYVLDQALGEKW
jgi:cytochrome c6